MPLFPTPALFSAWMAAPYTPRPPEEHATYQNNGADFWHMASGVRHKDAMPHRHYKTLRGTFGTGREMGR